MCHVLLVSAAFRNSDFLLLMLMLLLLSLLLLTKSKNKLPKTYATCFTFDARFNFFGVFWQNAHGADKEQTVGSLDADPQTHQQQQQQARQQQQLLVAVAKGLRLILLLLT